MAAPTGNHVYYQMLCAASVGLIAFTASVSMAFTSPALPSMHKDPDFSITKEDGSWIGSVVPAFAVLGSLAAGPLLDTFGRRRMIILSSLPLSLAWGIVATSSTVKGVIFGRMLTGVCVGFQAVAGPVLMAEIIQLELRARAAFYPAVLRNVGITVGYLTGNYLSWRPLAWVGCVLSLPAALILLPTPETPYFLTRSGKRESSLCSLKQLRQDSAAAEKEQETLDESCRNVSTKRAGLGDVLRPPNRWPVAIGAALMLAQQTTGVSTVIFYASSIFEAAGDSAYAKTASSILSIFDFLGTFIGFYCAVKYARRSMIARSSIGVTVCLSVLSAFFWAKESGGSLAVVIKEYTFIPLLALMAFKCSLSLGWGPVPWVYIREGLPSSVRGVGASLIVTTSWISAFAVTKTFQWSVSLLGIHTTFLCYAVLTFFNGYVIQRFMPETHRQSAAQMDRFYLNAAKEKEQ
ncbi:facilitated trehalose transporter Tret1-2 homolog isoform X1 [Macrobrachium nipponense]|uniref:facilitated trehalose transporter Tret1-2 homolog isoform X1 n=2 Tax=Macrobrachium nipponense TaxID=159736 RepID=UPI0030C87D37